MLAPAHAALYKARCAQWPGLYAAVQAVLGPTGTILRVGDRAGGAVDATTFVTTTQSTGLRATVTTRVSTTPTAPSGFGTPLDPASEASWQGVAPLVRLNGSTESMDAPDAAYWTRTLAAFSVGAWVKRASAAADATVIAKWDSTSGAEKQEWLLYFDVGAGDRITLLVYDETANAYIGRAETAAFARLNSWQHILATYDGTATAAGIKVYRNGVRVDDANANSGVFVQMQDTASLVHVATLIGSGGTRASFLNGTLAGGPLGPFFTQKELSANEAAGLFEVGSYGLGL